MSSQTPDSPRVAITRRQLVSGAGALGITAFLAACGSTNSGSAGNSSTGAAPASSPAASSSAAAPSAGSSAPAASSSAAAASSSAVAGGSSSAAPSRPATLKKMSFNLGFLPLPQYAAFYLGVAQGIYADHGIDLTINSSNGTATAIAQLFAGKDQCVFVPCSALLQAYKEPDNPAAKTFATLIIKDTSTIFFYKDSGIKTPKDLEGQTIITSAGSNEFREFPDFAKANGVDASKVKWQNVDSSLKVSLLTSGQAKVTSTAIYSLAQVEGQT